MLFTKASGYLLHVYFLYIYACVCVFKKRLSVYYFCQILSFHFPSGSSREKKKKKKWLEAQSFKHYPANVLIAVEAAAQWKSSATPGKTQSTCACRISPLLWNVLSLTFKGNILCDKCSLWKRQLLHVVHVLQLQSLILHLPWLLGLLC